MLSDKARVVTSPSFRRLQAKAQVFSLEENASVRTRLTHTLEVSMFGELIAGKCFNELVETGRIAESLRLPFVKTVESACLLHDIGNPPFGHLGEFAIRDWFHRNKHKVLDAWNVGREAADAFFPSFENFDGNPQGFRIVTRLQWLRDDLGLNLTCSLLASTFKYLGSRTDPSNPLLKKIGFFELDRPTVFEIWDILKLSRDTDVLTQRHPLAYLMEAADDIAYCLSDLEDAIEKGILSEAEIVAAFKGSFPDLIPKRRTNYRLYKVAPNSDFMGFKIKLTQKLIDRAVDLFITNHDAILGGAFQEALFDSDPEYKQKLSILKAFTNQRVFLSREAVDVELSGFHVVHSILERLWHLLCLSPAELRKLMPEATTKPPYGQMALEQRLFALLPRKHLLSYRAAVKRNPKIEPVLRTHLIVDYLSGMTDGHAVKIFKLLNGVSVGGRI
jgi:dGTPase